MHPPIICIIIYFERIIIDFIILWKKNKDIYYFKSKINKRKIKYRKTPETRKETGGFFGPEKVGPVCRDGPRLEVSGILLISSIDPLPTRRSAPPSTKRGTTAPLQSPNPKARVPRHAAASIPAGGCC